MDLNGVMAVTLRYFTEFGKPVFQHITASICGGIYVILVYSILWCVYDAVLRKFTFAISSPDEFLVTFIFASFSAKLHAISILSLVCLLFPRSISELCVNA